MKLSIQATIVEEERLEGYDVIIVGDKEIRFELVNGAPVTSSLEVARHFEKEHSKILRAIENFPGDDFTKANFGLSYYKDSSGKKNKYYRMTRDGFSMLVMGFTGKKAWEWKKNFLIAFNEMERRLRELGGGMDEERLERIFAESLAPLREEVRQIRELVERKKRSAFSKKVLEYFKKGEDLQIEAVKMVLKIHPEGINQSNLLKALGKKRDDRRGRRLLHDNIGRHWVVKQRGKEIVYFLKESAYLF